MMIKHCEESVTINDCMVHEQGYTHQDSYGWFCKAIQSEVTLEYLHSNPIREMLHSCCESTPD